MAHPGVVVHALQGFVEGVKHLAARVRGRPLGHARVERRAGFEREAVAVPAVRGASRDVVRLHDGDFFAVLGE